MDHKIIKNCYGNHNSLKIFLFHLKNDINPEDYNEDMFYPSPILYRQVGINSLNNDIVTISNEINSKYLHEAYINKCMKEIIIKYDIYEKMKIEINLKIIKKIKYNIPCEIFLEIQKFL
jgi:hypothetical protein